MKYIKHILIITLVFFTESCGVYSLSGTSIAKDVKSFQVNYFSNSAILVEPGLDRDFTLALQDLIQNQTNLTLETSGADLTFEGEITEYRISPTTATANNTAAQNRLTIGVNVRYYNKLDEEKDFEQRFSFFFDYAGSSQLTGAQRDTAIDAIYERITQDIFQKALANW